MDFKVEIDNLTFYINILSYHPATEGSHSWNAACPDEYYGEDEEIEWETSCVEDTLEDGGVEEVAVDIDQYADYIEKDLLKQISEMREESNEYY